MLLDTAVIRMNANYLIVKWVNHTLLVWFPRTNSQKLSNAFHSVHQLVLQVDWALKIHLNLSVRSPSHESVNNFWRILLTGLVIECTAFTADDAIQSYTQEVLNFFLSRRKVRRLPLPIRSYEKGTDWKKMLSTNHRTLMVVHPRWLSSTLYNTRIIQWSVTGLNRRRVKVENWHLRIRCAADRSRNGMVSCLISLSCL